MAAVRTVQGMLVACLTFIILTVTARGADEHGRVPERWDPTGQQAPRWLQELPPNFPVPLALGTSGGLSGRASTVKAALLQAAEHLRYCDAVTVRVAQLAVNRPPNSWLDDTSQVIPLGAPLDSSEVISLAQFVDHHRGLTWCLAAKAPEHMRQSLAALLKPYESLIAYQSAPPRWMQGLESLSPKLVGIGSAQRTTRPSDQLHRAFLRSLAALARQGSGHADIQSFSLRGFQFQQGLRVARLQASVRLTGVRFASLWRARLHDGLYVQLTVPAEQMNAE